MTVDDPAAIETAFVQKPNRDLAQVGRVQQVGEKAACLAICAADEYPALVGRQE